MHNKRLAAGCYMHKYLILRLNTSDCTGLSELSHIRQQHQVLFRLPTPQIQNFRCTHRQLAGSVYKQSGFFKGPPNNSRLSAESIRPGKQQLSSKLDLAFGMSQARRLSRNCHLCLELHSIFWFKKKRHERVASTVKYSRC